MELLLFASSQIDDLYAGVKAFAGVDIFAFRWVRLFTISFKRDVTVGK